MGNVIHADISKKKKKYSAFIFQGWYILGHQPKILVPKKAASRFLKFNLNISAFS